MTICGNRYAWRAGCDLHDYHAKRATDGDYARHGRLTKGSTALPIQCTKECYLMGSSIIPSNTEAMAAGNVVFGGLIGLGVDAASGAMNKYPDIVTVAMVPDQTCHAPASPRRARPAS